jgi:hypothetical protein
MLLLSAAVIFSLFNLVTETAFADTIISLEEAVHFTTAEGSDVILEAGDYEVEPAEEWIRITPSGGNAVDSLLLEAQSASHEETVQAPLALSTQGEVSDTHHLTLLLPGGKRLEAIGSYSGIRSRGRLSLLTIQRLQRLATASKSTTPTEFKTPLFGGSGGTRSYNLDCGNRSVLVGSIFKAGSWFDALGIICQRVNPQTGALGDEFTRGPVGGTGGNARIARCNDGDVAQGVSTRSGQFVNRLVIFCSRWDPSRKAPVFSGSTRCPSGENRCLGFGGTSAGRSDAFFCPSGKVGKAFRGKYGSYTDSARFVCDLWDK